MKVLVEDNFNIRGTKKSKTKLFHKTNRLTVLLTVSMLMLSIYTVVKGATEP